MFGDMDLVHAAAARERPAGAAASAPHTNPFARTSLDSSLSSGSTGSHNSSLSSSWGGFATSPRPSLLTRQLSAHGPGTALPPGGAAAATSNSAPISIPAAARASAGPASPAAPTAGAASFNFLRRHSLAGPYPSAGAAAGGHAGTAPGAAGVAAAAAESRARMPMLARSLSKGLSQSLDFR